MVVATRTPRRDSIAIAGSIAVHLCVLVLALAALPHTSFPVDDPDERTLLTSILRIDHRTPSVGKRHRAVAEAVQQRPVARPVVHAAVTRERAARKLIVAPEQRAGTTAARVPTPQPTVKPALVANAPIGVAPTSAAVAAAPAAAASPMPTASPAPSPVVAQHEEGIGNFGETYPATIDPSARGALLAGAAGVVVRVNVDENGHATSVEFVRPPADPALRDELRSRLLAARFTPASCNGLRCTGTVELRG